MLVAAVMMVLILLAWISWVSVAELKSPIIRHPLESVTGTITFPLLYYLGMEVSIINAIIINGV